MHSHHWNVNSIFVATNWQRSLFFFTMRTHVWKKKNIWCLRKKGCLQILLISIEIHYFLADWRTFIPLTPNESKILSSNNNKNTQFRQSKTKIKIRMEQTYQKEFNNLVEATGIFFYDCPFINFFSVQIVHICVILPWAYTLSRFHNISIFFSGIRNKNHIENKSSPIQAWTTVLAQKCIYIPPFQKLLHVFAW